MSDSGAGPDLEDERLARAALSRLAEPGDPRLTDLVARLGAPAVRDHLLADRERGALHRDLATRLDELDPEGELERAERLGLRFVIPGDREWPSGLDGLLDAGTVQERGGVPLGLWVRGLPLDSWGPGLSIVGSRSCTTYGATVAAEVAAVAARAGLCVVSGAAVGIDRAAHRGAVSADGATVAVLAGGADRPYPAAHTRMIEHIARVGAVVSEAAPGCSPMRVRFLARNRLIAALGRGTVLVEAATRSGALSTAGWAERLHRPLMGVPGPVTSAQSAGVHERIRTGSAVLVTSGQDVLELVGRPGEHLAEVPRAPERPRDRLTARQRQVLDAVPVSRAVGADSIARTAGMAIREVQSALNALAGRDLVRAEGRGWRLGEVARL